MRKISVVKSNRKTMSLEIKPDGSVICRAPLRAADSEIEAFIKSHEKWIEKHQNRIDTAIKQDTRQIITQDDIKLLKKRAAEYIPQRAEHFAKIIGVEYGKITIRAQKTRWGSCSSNKNLNFNCLLMLTDTEIIDYVVVHELCHIKEMNHSKKFWSLVESVLPDYKKQRSRLKIKSALLVMAEDDLPKDTENTNPLL